ncbi:MAG: hypothetical protein U0354_15805 [Candidatus Sericytochromatia bacterium]
MGFLENKKSPENEKKFLFRNEPLSSLKYAIQNFIGNTNYYYPNLFYIEGAEGSGKTWLINQILHLSQSNNIFSKAFTVKVDCKLISLSETLGLVNFMVKVRDSIVSKDESLQQAFANFDKAYDNFLNGTLADDTTNDLKQVPQKEAPKTRSLLQEKEAEKARLLELEKQKKLDEERRLREEQQAKTASKATDAKSRLASLRSQGYGSKQNQTMTINSKDNAALIPGKSSVKEIQQQEEINSAPTEIHEVNVKKQTGNLNMTGAYGHLNTYSEKELPRNRRGEADVKAIAKDLISTLESLKKGNVKPVDYKSILLRKFLQAIDLISNHRKLVLIFDSFDRIHALAGFLFNTFLKNLRTEIIVIIASQLDMERELKERYDTTLNYIYLQNFTYFEVEEYIRKNHVISEPGIIESIHELTSGAPLSLALVSGAFQNFKGDVFKIMKFLGVAAEDEKTLRYLNVIMLDFLPPHDKKMIILLAIIRSINYELIENIAGVFNSKNLVQSLSEKYSFIEEQGLPETLKKFTRTYAKHEAANLYEEIHRLASDYFSSKVIEEPENREYMLDNLYYSFKLQEEEGYTNLLTILSKYLSNDINFCDDALNTALNTAGISKEMKNRITVLKESLPYVVLKDHKRMLPMLEAISQLQVRNMSGMQILDGF